GTPDAGCAGASVLTGCDGDGFTVVASADMEVVKTQTDPLPANNPVPGGTNVTYRIVATNNGPSTATTVSVGDNFTVGSATFVSATPVAPNTNGLDCSGFTAFPGSCTVASLASGQSVSFDLVVTAPNDGTPSITDTATTSADQFDPVSNNTSSVTTTVCQSVDLTVTKVAENLACVAGNRKTTCLLTEILGGSDFIYHITVTNNDTQVDATNVLFTDTVPAGVSYVSVTPSNICTSGDISPDNNCNLGTIAKNSSVSFDIQVTAIEAGIVCNSANAEADQCDRNDADNTSASACVTVDTNNQPTALEADREAGPGSDPDGVANVSDVNRVFEPNETARIDPAWTNTLDNDTPTDVTGSVPTSGAGSFGFSDTAANGVTYSVDDATADYGVIPAHTQSDCNSATANGDCYEFTVNMPGDRPVQHWDTHFTETLSTGETKTWTLHIGDSFTDVPRSDVFYRFIETIFHNHITLGCQPASAFVFCPLATAKRGEMAAFVSRSIYGDDASVPSGGGSWNCTSTSQFADSFDTPTDQSYCRYANALKDILIVGGCDAVPDFCANVAVTRGDAAVMVAKGVSYLPPNNNTANPDAGIPLFGNDGGSFPGTGSQQFNCDSVDHTNTVTAGTIPAGTSPFPVDTLCSDPDAKYIGYLWIRHIVDGNGAGSYRPTDDILRDEVAKVLANAFVALPLYGPLTF
ncbi:MAG TPA: DUF11 domain-containing protein, partial [Thermoanaerobaculia bacterium]|nr:DUF11 domain-containing protein [Thermoanaerobaculia bacterium]